MACDFRQFCGWPRAPCGSSRGEQDLDGCGQILARAARRCVSSENATDRRGRGSVWPCVRRSSASPGWVSSALVSPVLRLRPW